jgi:hypothetical protein
MSRACSPSAVAHAVNPLSRRTSQLRVFDLRYVISAPLAASFSTCVIPPVWVCSFLLPNTLTTLSSLAAFADSDWANHRVERISTSGHVVLYNGMPISWHSGLQPVIALSTWCGMVWCLSYPPSVCSVTEGGGVMQRGPIRSLGSVSNTDRQCNPRLFGDGFVLVRLAVEKEWNRGCLHQTKSSGISLRRTCLALPATRWLDDPRERAVHRLIGWKRC